MSIVITTQYVATDRGGRIIAKGAGKQRTVQIDHSLTSEAKHATAAGELLNVLTNGRQQAMILHPSGGQRVRLSHERDRNLRARVRWTFDV